MENCGKDILSGREGSSQMQRYIQALDPNSLKLNDLSLKEWMQFAYRFANHVNYFNTINDKSPSGDWSEFFIEDANLDDFLSQVENGGNLPPHLALFVSFVRLIEFSKNRFNKLTKRHLDFYYHKILHIEKLPPTPDKVHIIFELAKNIVEEKIAKDTGLDGGKDTSGHKLIYKTTEDLIANKAVVASLKNVYNDHLNSKFKAAEVANSYDGKGADFPNKDIKWWPFGYYGDKNYPELPNARIGFAISGEILELREGSRNILITGEFKTALNTVSQAILHDSIEIYCSGEKKWLGPYFPQPEIQDDHGKTIFSSGFSKNQKKLKLAFQVPKEDKSVVNYNSEVLGERFNTSFPVCRILFKTVTTEGFNLYRNLIEKELNTLKVDVDVRDVKSLSLDNDIGTLNAEKPFYPFGTQPVKHSNFYIGYPELFKKAWKNISVNIIWKNTPEKSKKGALEAFVNLYYAYREDYYQQADSSNFFSGFLDKIEPIYLQKSKDEPPNLIVKSNNHFKATIQIKNKEDWIIVHNNKPMFETIDKDVGFKLDFSVAFDPNNYMVDKNGPLRLSLDQSFLHELFPRIYALAFGSKGENLLIPKEPYTPMVDAISLNYTAEAAMNLGDSKIDYEHTPISLFHEHPFGQSQEHPYLKNQHDFLSKEDKIQYLVPTYCKGGELYIGLKNVKNLQQVSLLIQVLEGSENPLADSFTGKQKAEWSVLCQNEWKNLNSDWMISNQTDNFLKSGIVIFSIPGEASDNNTLLPAGYIWVKVKIHKNYNAVCKAISIQAQAVMAEFTNNNNDLTHLEKGLKAQTISKLIQRISTVKSVSQPFSSFGGKPEESDDAYYRRISERLRHKNRAINLWDYEHIILQEFPEIHKVKCLNHTSETSFPSPGNVLLVVIPDIINKNVFDIYQPRVSRAKLNEVQNYINKLNTLHVNAVAINPDYEVVTVNLKVKFYKGYDENYYLKVLNKDITRLLSPWAFQETASLDFGVTLHRSLVINYIEKLKYVDFVEDVKLIKGGKISLTLVSPSSPKAILVSAKLHNLTIVQNNCTQITETGQSCET